MEHNLILNRRREIEQEVSRLKSLLSAYTVELEELDTVERVINRLSGAKRGEAGAAIEPKPAALSRPSPRNAMTMPQMIEAALVRAHRQGLQGLEPKAITESIAAHGKPEVKNSAVNSISWRMWKSGRLVKADNSAVYSLPDNEKAADLLSLGEQSAALSDQPAQGGEARPGGGI